MRAGWLLALAGCTTWRQESSTVAVTALVDDQFRGAEVSAAYQGNGIGFSVSASGQFLERDELLFALHRRDFGAGAELGMSISPIGLLASDDRLTRWFDLGVAGSAGGGLIYPSRLTTYGQVWGDLWMAVGLAPGTRHPTLIVSMRRLAVSEWDNATVFTVSLAFTRRFENGSFNFGLH